MDSQAITGQKTRRGFNLIESAIVLGVVGLVIGGIWVAAASFYAKSRANSVVDVVNMSIEVYRKYDRETVGVNVIRFLDGKELPAGFSYDRHDLWGSSIVYGNGVILDNFENYLNYGDGLFGNIYFSESPINYKGKPQPETCLALYKYFVAQKWSPIVTPDIIGFNPTMDNDMSAVAAACETVTTFSFYGLYP